MAKEFYNWAEDEPNLRSDRLPVHAHRITEVPARLPERPIDTYHRYAEAYRDGVPSFYQPQPPVIIQSGSGPLEKVIALILGAAGLGIVSFVIIPLLTGMMIVMAIMLGLGVLALLMIVGGIGTFWNGYNGHRTGRHVSPRRNRDHTRT